MRRGMRWKRRRSSRRSPSWSASSATESVSFDLKESMTARQQLVEAYLRELLVQEKHAPPELVEAMRYSLLAPGKRLRPVLVCMAAQAAGGSDRQALPAAAAVEM